MGNGYVCIVSFIYRDIVFSKANRYMGIKLEPGSNKVLLKIKNLDKLTDKQLRISLYDSGKKLKQTASTNILKKPKSGRKYIRRDKLGRRRVHIASAPGESWANRTGEARRGLVYRVSGTDKLIFGNIVEHAAYMENGTSNVKPRPAHLISIRQNNKNITRYIKNRIDKALKG